MAVEQVSQIQVRSGLLQDLGHLAKGEFGWSIDELKLFIGNGLIVEGAPYEGKTEIITRPTLLKILGGSDEAGLLPAFLYRFRGVEAGYTVQTGPDPSSHVLRILQNKLDDTVNVRDFGARGDGINNDLDAIQRCIDQIYDRLSLFTGEETRRVINFAPGIYTIYGELRIPPFATLRGAGKESVIIRQMSFASSGIFRTTNAVGADDARMLEGGFPPGQIEISNITFEMLSSADKYVGSVNSATSVLFHRVRFRGPYTKPLYQDNGTCLRIRADYFASRNFYIQECEFVGMSNGITVTDSKPIDDIVVQGSTFADLVQGVVVTTAHSVTAMGLRINNNFFDNIKERGVYVTNNVEGVTTSTNTFLNVAYNYTANLATYPNTTPVCSFITFGGNSSYSFGDMFLNRYDNDYLFPAVEHNAADIISLDTVSSMRYGSTYQTIGRSVLITNLTASYVPIMGRLLSGRIDYVVERYNSHRTGSLTFSVDTTANVVSFRDSYTEANPTNVLMEMEYSTLHPYHPGYKPILIIKSLNDDSNISVVTYDVKSQDAKTILDPTVRRSLIESPFTTTTTTTRAPTTTTTSTTTSTSTTSTSTTSTSTSTSTSTTSSSTTSTTTLPGAFGGTYSVTRYDDNNYLINGSSNLTIYLQRGFIYYFNVYAPGYPFWIKSGTPNQLGAIDAWNQDVSNNGTDDGTIAFAITSFTPPVLYYIAGNNPAMTGTIHII